MAQVDTLAVIVHVAEVVERYRVPRFGRLPVPDKRVSEVLFGPGSGVVEITETRLCIGVTGQGRFQVPLQRLELIDLHPSAMQVRVGQLCLRVAVAFGRRVPVPVGVEPAAAIGRIRLQDVRKESTRFAVPLAGRWSQHFHRGRDVLLDPVPAVEQAAEEIAGVVIASLDRTSIPLGGKV